MSTKFEIDLNPMTIHAAIEAADGEEYRIIRDNIEEITRITREGNAEDEWQLIHLAKEIGEVIEHILHDPEFIAEWKESAADLIAAA